LVLLICWIQLQGTGSAANNGPSTSAAGGADDEVPDDIDDDDDDELDLDELNELEASLAKTSIQINEPGAEA
jgi:hypothetical protein